MEKPNFDPIEAMYDHLENLKQQQERLSCLIEAVTNTIREMKGERSMSDQEKFFAFQKQIKENEKQYGLEAHTLYGEDPVHQTNQKLLAMNPSKAQIFQKLEADIKNKLERAVSTGELPQGEIGKKVVQLHKQWLCCVWESYSPQAHRGLAHLYTADERFRAYYDNRLFG